MEDGEVYCIGIVFEIADLKPTRTNWDAINNKHKIAEMGVSDIYHEKYFANLARTWHETRESAIAANLAWLDAPEDTKGAT